MEKFVLCCVALCRCHLFNGLFGRVGVVAVGRPGYSTQLSRVSSKNGLFYFVNSETEDVSSTLIRKRLADGESVADLTGEAVANWLIENEIDKCFQRHKVCIVFVYVVISFIFIFSFFSLSFRK